MSIDIRELDASPTLRNLSKEEKQAVVRLMELSIEETMKANNTRIDKLEAVRKAAQTHMDFHGKQKGISKTNDDLLNSLAECGT